MKDELLRENMFDSQSDIERAHADLLAWCAKRNFAGHDPFDGLNSRLFRATPLRHSSLARLFWTQALKRSPVNLRALARVPVGKNAKGTALFALAALARWRASHTAEAEREAYMHLDELLSMQIQGGSGAAWGYNFDWQSRNFFAPRGTPTIVPTAFAARAFLEASQAFNERKLLDVAQSVCEFILHDLPRSDESDEEVCFSYTPIDTTRIFNASLLAGETLACTGALTGERELCEQALRAARYVVRRQRADGSWSYGAQWYQSWVDNFHTAFMLLSLVRIMKACRTKDEELMQALGRGYEFWQTRFFLADGWPKYYHDRSYPADVHSAAASIVALVELREIDPAGAHAQAKKIARWALKNLRDERGYFYYQRRRFYTVRTPYMRWGQSWMLYALARLTEVSGQP